MTLEYKSREDKKWNGEVEKGEAVSVEECCGRKTVKWRKEKL